MSKLAVINVAKWLDENKSSFVPPVCNKLMHNEQLTIMFVGGPNQREDYHIEEGEEFFYQLKGDMCVKIVENGHHKDVHIREGEAFILPARIPHSPQRTANSIGLVVERRRAPTELEGVRWMVPGTTEPLYEKWFHCRDLGVELAPIIKAYFASDEYKTKIPGNNVMDKLQLPFDLITSLLDSTQHGPFNLEKRIEQLTKLSSSSSSMASLTSELDLQFDIIALRKGTHANLNKPYPIDTWLWQLKGSSLLKQSNEVIDLNKYDSILLDQETLKNITINIDDDDSILLMICQYSRL